LITCITNSKHEHSVFQNFDDQMMVAVNKAISNEQSGLNKLLKLTKKYEEDIHMVYIDHLDIVNYWGRRVKELKEEYVLPNYSKNIDRIKDRSEIKSLNHLEDEAIFLLLDPYDEARSRNFLNLGMLNSL